MKISNEIIEAFLNYIVSRDIPSITDPDKIKKFKNRSEYILVFQINGIMKDHKLLDQFLSFKAGIEFAMECVSKQEL